MNSRRSSRELFYPDTLVGTDSHTTMINGLGVVGWGVGGIEAEAGMLGQPVYFLTPEVVGVHLTGTIARRRHRDRSRAAHHADAARAESGRQVRRVLRRRRGVAAGCRSRDDRQHGARVRRDHGIFPGRRGIGQLICARPVARDEQCAAFENYFRAQKMFGMPRKGEIDYSVDLELDLGDVQPSVAGPKRPQDRINLPELGDAFRSLLQKPVDGWRLRKTRRRS